MTRLLALLLLPYMAFAASSTAPLRHTLVTLHGDCQLQMPSTPERRSQLVSREESGLQMEYEAYLADDGRDRIYMLLIATYASGMDPVRPEANMEGFLNGMLGYHEDNELLDARFEPLAGRQAMSFLVKNQNRHFCGHVLVEGQKLYLLAIEGPAHESLQSTYKDYAQSFSLIDSSGDVALSSSKH